MEKDKKNPVPEPALSPSPIDSEPKPIGATTDDNGKVNVANTEEEAKQTNASTTNELPGKKSSSSESKSIENVPGTTSDSKKSTPSTDSDPDKKFDILGSVINATKKLHNTLTKKTTSNQDIEKAPPRPDDFEDNKKNKSSENKSVN